MLKKIAIGVILASLLVVGVVGIVLAQDPTPPADDSSPQDGWCPLCGGQGPLGGMGRGWMGGMARGLRGMMGQGWMGGMGPGAGSIDRLAEVLGMTPDELYSALAEGQSIADLAEAKGVEREVIEALTDRFSGMAQLPAQVADKLGMTIEELRAAMADGQSIAELAEAKGVELGDITAIVMSPVRERIQQAVTDGCLTQEQADRALQKMEEFLLQRLESGMGTQPGKFRGGRGLPFHGGRGGNCPGMGGQFFQPSPSPDL